jgi:riboflavin kinase/FMN adenylyltransferase
MTPRVYHGLERVPADFGPSALTIGNFDGVHAGHREIFRRLAAIGVEEGWKPSVLTFDPHPAKIVAPSRAPRLLSTVEQRCAWMGEAGIVQVVVAPFGPELAALTAGEFVDRIIADSLDARAVLVGENFRFGKGAAGNVEFLRRAAGARGIRVEVVPGVRLRGRMISSTEIRRLIGAGEVSKAARLLGRPYALEGIVVAGHGVGAKQTVPTLNLATAAEVLPANGVYVTRTLDLDSPRVWPSVSNIGYRPTFGGDALSIESFLLEGLDGLPPSRIRMELLLRLRDERKFGDAAALRAQILRDASRARSYHRRRATLAVVPCR